MVVGLATSYLIASLPDEALRAVGQALSDNQQTGARMSEAELYRLKGEALIAQTSTEAEARACFEKAIAVARDQEAKSWQLRATMSLARLVAKAGLRDEARAMLGDIYNWFTEGFDTADLKDAKALLDELAG